VRRLILIASLILAVPGCDGGGGTDAGLDAGPRRDAGDPDAGRCTEFTPEYCPREYPMTPIPASMVCEAFVDAFCRANGLCCSDDTRVYRSFEACRIDQMDRCEDELIGFEFPDRIASGIVGYNQGAAGGQFSSLATMGDMCVPIRYGDEIMSIYRGTVARGDACTHSVECADRGVCFDAGGISTCLGAPQRADPCDSNDNCAPSGLRCNGSMGCDFRLPLESPCVENRDCESFNCRMGFCFDPTPDSTYCVDIGEPGPAFE